MAQWQKTQIRRDNGMIAEAQAPMIISASRSTDIPAFYADWFFHRLKVGYSAWTNPFNGVKSFVSYEKCRFIVFWSKNPKPLLKHLDELKERNIGCYIQYTLNDYVKEGLEKGVVLPLEKRIGTFKRLVDQLGQGLVIWRFDPLILTDQIGLDDLLEKVENIGDQLKGYTEKLVFSFADIALYKKVKANLEKSHVNYEEWTTAQMEEFAQRLSELNQKWHYQLATCGEKIDIEKYGIQHNRCVDDDLMIRFAHHDKALMDFLGVEIKTVENSLFGAEPIPTNAIRLSETQYALKKRDNRDKGQRQFCGCMVSKDIGEYNTCPHLCEYCYANASKEMAQENYNKHETNPLGETITGK
jgi:DNA repair photolyase